MGMPVITPGHGTRCQAITDIIESVALQEAALAHILNAEGEKLQHVIALPSVAPNQLLQFNESVRQTILSAAQLEAVLQEKLQLFSPCLCTCTNPEV